MGNVINQYCNKMENAKEKLAERIVKKEDDSFIVPEFFKEVLSKIHFFIYGNGNNAEKVYEELFRFDCIENIEGIVVGEEYWKEEQFFHGIKVEKFDVDTKYDNLLVSFDPNIFWEDLSLILNNDNIKKIYIFHSWEMFITNHWLGIDSSRCIFVDNYYKIASERRLTQDYYQNNIDKFELFKSWLCDDYSQKVMDCYIEGHIKQKNFPMLKVWKHEDIKNQYFPTFIDFSDHEIVVDCGAYTGDTFESYIYHVGSFQRYYALEPDLSVNKQLKKLTMFYENAVVIEKGVASSSGETGFELIAGGCSNISEESMNRIVLTTIDEEITENVSFIKMDIEGAELDALRGAERMIERCKPKLAICVYHKREDLIEIPAFLKSIRPDYKFYLRSHQPNLSELVLYAI